MAEAIPLAQTGKHRKKALVVISDGNDQNSQTAIAALQAQIRETEVLVYAIGIDSQTETEWAPRRSWGGVLEALLAPARSGQALMQARPRPSPFPIPGRRTQPSAPSAGQSPAEDSGLAGAVATPASHRAAKFTESHDGRIGSCQRRRLARHDGR